MADKWDKYIVPDTTDATNIKQPVNTTTPLVNDKWDKYIIPENTETSIAQPVPAVPSYLNRVWNDMQQPAQNLYSAWDNFKNSIEQSKQGNVGGAITKGVSTLGNLINYPLSMIPAAAAPITELAKTNVPVVSQFGQGAKNMMELPGQAANTVHGIWNDIINKGNIPFTNIPLGPFAGGLDKTLPQNVQNLGLSNEDAREMSSNVDSISNLLLASVLPEAVGKTLDVSKPLLNKVNENIIQPSLNLPGKVAQGITGLTTQAGPEAMKAATEGIPATINAMRGKVGNLPADIVGTAANKLNKVAEILKPIEKPDISKLMEKYDDTVPVSDAITVNRFIEKPQHPVVDESIKSNILNLDNQINDLKNSVGENGEDVIDENTEFKQSEIDRLSRERDALKDKQLMYEKQYNKDLDNYNIKMYKYHNDIDNLTKQHKDYLNKKKNQQDNIAQIVKNDPTLAYENFLNSDIPGRNLSVKDVFKSEFTPQLYDYITKFQSFVKNGNTPAALKLLDTDVTYGGQTVKLSELFDRFHNTLPETRNLINSTTGINAPMKDVINLHTQNSMLGLKLNPNFKLPQLAHQLPLTAAEYGVGHVLGPAGVLATAPLFSPRLMGETANIVGKVSRGINTVGGKIPEGLSTGISEGTQGILNTMQDFSKPLESRTIDNSTGDTYSGPKKAALPPEEVKPVVDSMKNEYWIYQPGGHDIYYDMYQNKNKIPTPAVMAEGQRLLGTENFNRTMRDLVDHQDSFPIEVGGVNPGTIMEFFARKLVKELNPNFPTEYEQFKGSPYQYWDNKSGLKPVPGNTPLNNQQQLSPLQQTAIAATQVLPRVAVPQPPERQQNESDEDYANRLYNSGFRLKNDQVKHIFEK